MTMMMMMSEHVKYSVHRVWKRVSGARERT